MRMVELGDLAEVVSGATPKTDVPEYWGGDLPWATPADLSKLDGAYISETPRKLTDAGARSCATTVLPEGSVLLSSRAPIGHVAINRVPMATNQGFKSLVPGPHLDSKFLYHWLRANSEYLKSVGNGATFKELSKRTTERIKIPLPIIGEQRRIAAILDQADAIRAKRRKTLAHLDALKQSIFHEMFGASTRWEAKPICKLGRVTTGRTPPTSAEGMFGGPIPFVTPGDLGRDSQAARSLSEKGAKASRLVGPGAALLCCIGATIGKVGIARQACAFNQQINAVEWGDEIDDMYGMAAIERLKPVIVARGSSTTLPLLTKGQFSKMEIPVPSIHLQRQFSARIQRINSHGCATRRAIRVDDELFASLQSRAFRGDL